MKLNHRLSAVAALVRDGARLVDVGSDHAHLPVALVGENRIPSAIATDIIPGPVASAVRNVTDAGLADRIEVRLGDGLAPVSPEEADDIVIAGMGGENIAGILSRAPWTKHSCYRLILQPMTRPEELRRFLADNGYEIEREVTTKDGIHHHVTMVASYTGKSRPSDDFSCLIGKLDRVRDGEYLRLQYRRLLKKADGLRKGGESSAEAEIMAEKMRLFLEGS